MLLGFLGTTEVVVILVIALLVFGPNKLPEIGKQIGSAYRELNKMRSDVQRALDIDVYGNNHNNTYDTPNYGNHSNYGTTYPQTPALDGPDDYSYTYGEEERYKAEHSMPPGFVAPPGPAAAQQQTFSSAVGPVRDAEDTEHDADAANGFHGFSSSYANGNAAAEATESAPKANTQGNDHDGVTRINAAYNEPTTEHKEQKEQTVLASAGQTAREL
jgi:sec-independent protein translocase protein TatA